MFKKLLNLTVIICFVLTTLVSSPHAHATSFPGLPAPGAMVNLSPAYQPVIIRGLTVHKDNPFLFDFIVDVGQDKLSTEPLKKAGERLIKYFLASLAIPDKDVWVNLSPYEKDRMIPEALGQTDMGRDLLEQDYILKQITASLIYPEKQIGKTFWDSVYAKAQAMYGTNQIPVNTFNKVWIMADRAEVFEHNQTAFVVDSHLKVMLEEDYLALSKYPGLPGGSSDRQNCRQAGCQANQPLNVKASQGNPRSDAPVTHSLASQIIKKIVLPELEKEVNTGKNFANLRQIFNSIILASWYKKNLQQALLNQVYADKSKVKGIDLNDVTIKQQIYEQYLKAYKKGVFNYIKEDINTENGERMPRKYFSGGINEAMAADPAVTSAPERFDFAMKSAGELVDISIAVVQGQNPPAQQFNNTGNIRNPFLVEMRGRIQAVGNRFPELQGAVDRITNPESLHGDWLEFEYGGETIRTYDTRVRNNTILGPAKGGIRFVPASFLLGTPEFNDAFAHFQLTQLTDEQTEQDQLRLVESFIAEWINQEAQALAMGMTLKNAGIGLDLGGGKGAVFIGRIKKEGGKWIIEDYPGWKDNKTLQAKIARAHSRNLAESNNVGIDIDIPAPDMNTDGDVLSWYQDEYLKHIALNTNEIESVLPDLSAQLRGIPLSEDPTKTPYLDVVVKYFNDHQGVSLPWLGVYTGKPLDIKKGIDKGGVDGRGPATGEGVCDLIEAVLGESLKGMRVAIQGNGNVAQPIGPRLVRQGAIVTVISDGGGTYINHSGFTLETLNRLNAWKADNTKEFIRNAPTEVFDREGLEIVEGDIYDRAAEEARRKAVLEADVEIVIPAAKEGEITEDNAPRIKARYIFEGANGPTKAAAERILYERGVAIYPDTLANAGGVFVSSLETEQAKSGRRLTLEEVATRRRDAIVNAYNKLRDLDAQLQSQYPDLTLRQLMDILALRRIQEKMDAAMSTFVFPQSAKLELELDPQARVDALHKARLLGEITELASTNEGARRLKESLDGLNIPGFENLQFAHAKVLMDVSDDSFGIGLFSNIRSHEPVGIIVVQGNGFAAKYADLLGKPEIANIPEVKLTDVNFSGNRTTFTVEHASTRDVAFRPRSSDGAMNVSDGVETALESLEAIGSGTDFEGSRVLGQMREAYERGGHHLAAPRDLMAFVPVRVLEIANQWKRNGTDGGYQGDIRQHLGAVMNIIVERYKNSDIYTRHKIVDRVLVSPATLTHLVFEYGFKGTKGEEAVNDFLNKRLTDDVEIRLLEEQGDEGKQLAEEILQDPEARVFFHLYFLNHYTDKVAALYAKSDAVGHVNLEVTDPWDQKRIRDYLSSVTLELSTVRQAIETFKSQGSEGQKRASMGRLRDEIKAKIGFVQESSYTQKHLGWSAFFDLGIVKPVRDTQTFSNFSYIDMGFFRQLGAVELTLDGYVLFDSSKRSAQEYTAQEVESQRILADVFGITMTIHGPFIGQPMKGGNTLQRAIDFPQAAIEQVVGAQRTGAPSIVYHMTDFQFDNEEDRQRNAQAYAKFLADSYGALFQEAKEEEGARGTYDPKIKIGFENYYALDNSHSFPTAEEFMDQWERIGNVLAAQAQAGDNNARGALHYMFGLLFDSAHYNLSNRQDPYVSALVVAQRLRQFGQKIETEFGFEDNYARGLLVELHLNENIGQISYFPAFSADIHSRISATGPIANAEIITLFYSLGFEPMVMMEQMVEFNPDDWNLAVDAITLGKRIHDENGDQTFYESADFKSFTKNYLRGVKGSASDLLTKVNKQGQYTDAYHTLIYLLFKKHLGNVRLTSEEFNKYLQRRLYQYLIGGFTFTDSPPNRLIPGLQYVSPTQIRQESKVFSKKKITVLQNGRPVQMPVYQLFRRGQSVSDEDNPHGVFFIVKAPPGQAIAAYVQFDNGHTIEIRSGMPLGEMAASTGGMRSANVYLVPGTSLIGFSPESLVILNELMPDFQYLIGGLVSRRQGESQQILDAMTGTGDLAMGTKPEQKINADKATLTNLKGGIDLNTSNGMQWKVSKDGMGVEMNVDPALIARVKAQGIDSLRPVIFRITPITSVWPLVGLESPESPESRERSIDHYPFYQIKS